MSALRLINQTEISSAVTEVSVDNIFSSDFDIYKIVLSGLYGSGSAQWLRFRYIRTGGKLANSSSYDYAQHRLQSNLTVSEERNTNQDNSLYAGLGYINTTSTDGTTAESWFFNPFSTNAYTFQLGQGSYNNGTNLQSVKGISVYKSNDSMQGIKFYKSAGNIDGGLIKVYGLTQGI